MDFTDVDRFELYSAAGQWVPITTYVRPGRGEITAGRGRGTEFDAVGPGGMSLAIDNASGRFTPGSAYADLALTQLMPIRLFSIIGYRSFPILTGWCQLPDTTENLAGVDNLINVTVVDRKELLDGGRTLISNLAEYIQSATTTLVCFYPLGDLAAPFLDVVGSGPPFMPELTFTAAGTSVDAATLSPAAGPIASGDDMRGVLFAPTLAVQSSAFPTLAQGYRLSADFDATSGTAFTSGVPLTLILWVSITGQYDTQSILTATVRDVATSTEVSSLVLQRVLQDPAGAATNFGRVSMAWSWSGSGITGNAVSSTQFITTGAGLVPIGVQLTINPNNLKLWIGPDEFTAPAVPFGSPASPAELYGALQLGPLEGALSHFQIHVGDYTHSDFLAQYAAGRVGLSQQRPDERIVSALWFAGASHNGALDEGSTYLQQVSVAGRTAGQLIDDATAAERGRFFYDGAGLPVFQSRVRTTYNL